VPPKALTVAEPLLAPHVAVVEDVVALSAVGSDIDTASVKVQPLASVTVTVNVPAVKFVGVCTVEPLLHE